MRHVRTGRAPRVGTRLGGGRRGRLLAAVGAAGAAVVAVSACEPVGGLNTASIAITTDQAGTQALESAGVNVSWLSCTATLQGDQRATVNPTATARQKSVATVDCQGQTARGSKITITGRVTSEVDGRCVRGSLTARVAGQVVFQVGVLGNCAADEPTGNPRPTVTHTVQPPSSGHPTGEPPGTPPVTVTVTATPDPDPDPDPDPSPSDTCSDDGQGHDGQGNDGHGHDDGGHDGQDGNQDQHSGDQQHTWAADH